MAPKIKLKGMRSIPAMVDAKLLNPDLTLNQDALSRHETVTLGDRQFVKLNKLGQGAVGSAFLLYDEKKQEFPVVKTSIPLYPENPGSGEEATRVTKNFTEEQAFLQAAGKSPKKGIFLQRSPDDEKEITANVLMQFASGVDGSQFAKSTYESLTPPSALRLVELAQKADAQMSALHRQGILHGDINPGNFKIDGAEVGFIDFGSALVMDKQGKAYLGKGVKPEAAPGYFAPELEVKADNIAKTKETDVYALGVLLKKNIFGTEGPLAEKKHALSDDPELLKFLNSLTAENPADRPSEDERKKFWHAYRQSLLPVSQVKVGFLNVYDYHMSDAAGKKQFLDALQQMDDVVLVNTADNAKKMSALDLELIKRDLNANGINIRTNPKPHKDSGTENLLVIVPNANDLSDVPKLLEKHHKKNETPIQIYFNICKDPHPIKNIHPLPIVADGNSEHYRYQVKNALATMLVTPEHINQIKYRLNKELEAIQDKYGSKLNTPEGKIAAERMRKLEKAIDTLIDHPMNYLALGQMLDNLQKEMRPTSGIKKLLNLESRGSKELGKIKEYSQQLGMFAVKAPHGQPSKAAPSAPAPETSTPRPRK